ncbi:hypothetical protein NUSPORA_01017 [Nucleospora cyclopteri]
MQRYLRKQRVKHQVTKCTVERVVKKKSYELSESQKLAKMVALEVCGLSPYEKKAVEYMKNDNIKKARKFLKIRLGSLNRGEKKMDTLMKFIR